jgi:putative DNA primase/helicase
MSAIPKPASFSFATEKDNLAGKYETPVPLRTSLGAAPYPLNALPSLIKEAIYEAEESCKAPMALIAASALSAISAAVQGLVSVQRSEGLSGPASLFFLTLAASGERKTSVDNLFSKAIREWELEQKEAAKPVMAEYHADMTAWQTILEGYKSALKASAQKRMPSDDIAAELKGHELEKPLQPRIPSLLYMDVTPEKFAIELERWPVAAILSNEAGIIFGAHGMNPESVMRNLSQMNVCWDGGLLKRDRATTQSVTVEGMRVTLGLQIQPETLRSFLSKNIGLARGTGFLARFLVSHPDSTMGTRHFSEVKTGQPAIAAFNARIKRLLDARPQVDEFGNLTTTYLTLSPAAKELWVDFYNVVEEDLGKGGPYQEIQDVASKAPDNAARLAACLHTFCDQVGSTEIDDHSMRTATVLMQWYLHEAIRFSGDMAVPQEVRDAELLEEFLAEIILRKMDIPRESHVAQSGPNSLRDKKKRDSAVATLHQHHRIFRWDRPTGNGKGKSTEKCLGLPDEVLAEWRERWKL